MKTLSIACVVIAIVSFGFLYARGKEQKMEKSKTAQPGKTAEGVFAAGCFWCTEADFEKVDGVIEALSGYTGGRVANPTYQQVSAGGTGHLEAVKVIYDPSKITYAQLLQVFWRHVNPTDAGGQFVDRGSQYRPAIFYHDDEQKMIAEEVIAEIESSEIWAAPIVTQLKPFRVFFKAEEYHQNYYKRNPYQGYCQVVITPKVAKIRKLYVERLKPERL